MTMGAISSAKQALVRYMSTSDLHNDSLCIHWHSFDETKILIQNLSLDGIMELEKVKAVTITIPNSQRIGEKDVDKMKKEGELIMKSTFSEKDKHLKKALKNRNLRCKSSGLDKANLLIVENEEKEPMVIILRDVLSKEHTNAYNSFRQMYNSHNTLYTRGCRAAPFPPPLLRWSV